MTDPRDPYVGENFIDLDWRSAGRRVRVIEQVERGVYIIENIDHWNAKMIGHRSRIKASTLIRKYRKASH